MSVSLLLRQRRLPLLLHSLCLHPMLVTGGPRGTESPSKARFVFAGIRNIMPSSSLSLVRGRWTTLTERSVLSSPVMTVEQVRHAPN